MIGAVAGATVAVVLVVVWLLLPRAIEFASETHVVCWQGVMSCRVAGGVVTSAQFSNATDTLSITIHVSKLVMSCPMHMVLQWRLRAENTNFLQVPLSNALLLLSDAAWHR